MKYKTNLIEGDCLEIMPQLEESSFDLILADPPYGITACKWDEVIPFNNHIYVDVRNKKKLMYRDEYALHMLTNSFCGENIRHFYEIFDKECTPGMWENIKRLLKPNGAVVLFGSQPFTSKLVCSNLKWFRYCWVWEKNGGSNFATVRWQPFREHEDIAVFYKKFGTYNPQRIQRTFESLKRYAAGKVAKIKAPNRTENPHSKLKKIPHELPADGLRNPRSILTFDRDKFKTQHPTQKPAALMEYLIKTYTDQGDSVLDFCMGSGSTGIACQYTGRDFTGIELEKKFFKIAQQRMKENNVLLVRG